MICQCFEVANINFLFWVWSNSSAVITVYIATFTMNSSPGEHVQKSYQVYGFVKNHSQCKSEIKTFQITVQYVLLI